MAAYTYIGDGNPDGIMIQASSSEKIGFYGATPIARVTASSYATSLVATASSADVTSDTKAALIAVMNTLSALGLWPTQA